MTREKSLLGGNKKENTRHWIHSMVPALPGWLAVFWSDVTVWTEPVAFWALVEFPANGYGGVAVGQELVGVTAGVPEGGVALEVQWSELTSEYFLGYVHTDEFRSEDAEAKNKAFWERQAREVHEWKQSVRVGGASGGCTQVVAPRE